MKNPLHPGRLVKENIEEMGLSVAKAAEGLGVTRQQLYKVINCESTIRAGNGRAARKGDRQHGRCMAQDASRFDLAQVRQHAGQIVVRRLTPEPS